MEEICQRFPSIMVKIVGFLDNKSLVTFKEASRVTNKFLSSERLVPIRIIAKYKGNFVDFQDSWNKVIKGTPFEIINALASATEEFPTLMTFWQKTII